MEKQNQEPTVQFNLEQALWKINDGEMLQFSPSGYKIFKYVGAHDTQSRLMRVGESVHSYSAIVKEPVLQMEASSLVELFISDEQEHLTRASQNGEKNATEEFSDWAENLISPDDVIEAAYKSLIDDETCENEKPRFPKIVLKNELTGEVRVIELDLASLIINGDVDVQSGGYENLYSDDFQIAERSLRFKVSTYLDRCLADIGIDKHNAVKTCDDYVGKVDLERADVMGYRAYWQKRGGKVIGGTDSRLTKMTAHEILTAGQVKLNSAYNQSRSNASDCVPQEWSLQPLRPFQDVLENLSTTISEAGYTLGFTQSITASGETGPAFFVLDTDGNVVVQLSSDSSIRGSLEKAALKLQTLRR